MNARDALLQLCDQSNWPDGLKGDALRAYTEAMDQVHQVVMDFWPELTAKELEEKAAMLTETDVRCPNCRRSWELFPPARVQEAVYVNGRISGFQDGQSVRCVDCKAVFDGVTHERKE